MALFLVALPSQVYMVQNGSPVPPLQSSQQEGRGMPCSFEYMSQKLHMSLPLVSHRPDLGQKAYY